MLKTVGLLLVAFLALASGRELVCQIACAQPDAAHASATCHEPGNVDSRRLQSSAAHCVVDATAPAVTTVKAAGLQQQVAGLVTHTPSPSLAWTVTSAGLRTSAAVHRSPRHSLGLRI